MPALVGLLFKLFVLAHVVRGGKASTLFLSLIIVFAIHNAIEIVGYFNFTNINHANDATIGLFFRLYYVATVFVILYVFLHGLSVTKLENPVLTGILIALSTGVSALVLFTELVVAGQYLIGYSMTAIKGPAYWLFTAYLLIFLISNFGVILYGYKTNKSDIDAIRVKYSFYSLTPIMLVFIAAVLFKITGLEINATGLVPIATAIFLGIVLKTEDKHKLSDLRRFMPRSQERKTTTEFMHLLDQYIKNTNKENVYKDLQIGIEKEIIKYSLAKCDGNITNTAKMMGLKNRSTLYSMINRLELDLKELKYRSSE